MSGFLPSSRVYPEYLQDAQFWIANEPDLSAMIIAKRTGWKSSRLRHFNLPGHFTAPLKRASHHGFTFLLKYLLPLRTTETCVCLHFPFSAPLATLSTSR